MTIKTSGMTNEQEKRDRNNQEQNSMPTILLLRKRKREKTKERKRGRERDITRWHSRSWPREHASCCDCRCGATAPAQSAGTGCGLSRRRRRRVKKDFKENANSVEGKIYGLCNPALGRTHDDGADDANGLLDRLDLGLHTALGHLGLSAAWGKENSGANQPAIHQIKKMHHLNRSHPPLDLGVFFFFFFCDLVRQKGKVHVAKSADHDQDERAKEGLEATQSVLLQQQEGERVRAGDKRALPQLHLALEPANLKVRERERK
jgi:hypothetical protein